MSDEDGIGPGPTGPLLLRQPLRFSKGPVERPAGPSPGQPRWRGRTPRNGLSRTRRGLRRAAFGAGALLRSSATLAGLHRDGRAVLRRVADELERISPEASIERAMERALGLVDGVTSRSRAIQGLGIDARRVRRRLLRRRDVL